MSNKQVNCQNCEQPYQEGFRFCPHCGQKTNDDLTIGILFYNTISNYFSFDARFLKSFLPLMFKPGHLAKEFIKGKRLLYLHPAQMYLFISVIFFFVISFSTRELVSQANTFNEKVVKGDIETKTVNTDSVEAVLDSIQLEKVLKPLKENQDKLGLKEDDFKIPDSIIKSANNEPNNIKSSFDFNKKKIDSMIDAGIHEGDTVIIKRTDTADNGKIVVALIDEHEAMLKRIRKKGKVVALESANKNYETKIFGPDRVKVQGVLVSLYRNF